MPEDPNNTPDGTSSHAVGVSHQMLMDTVNDIAALNDIMTQMGVLLGDATVEGSIRAWRAQVTNTYSRDSQRLLADLLISSLQNQRRITRTLLRLCKMYTGDNSSADVGPENASR